METKELKINPPEGYKIDRENSTFECIKFKPIKKNITYKDVCKKLFKYSYYFTDESGLINLYTGWESKFNKNNATNHHQLKKLLALNQLLNIAKYYNRLHNTNTNPQTIEYDAINQKYYTRGISINYLCGISAIFNRKEDAQAVIDNPNFREILDTIFINNKNNKIITIEQAKELLPILQAFAEGKEVEIKKEGSEWQILKENDMQYIDFRKCDLRIKPKYRPFKDGKEFWREMQKHKPVGWLKASNGKFFIKRSRIDAVEINFGVNDNWYSYEYVFNNYTFADGTPFGIMEN